MIQDIFEQLIDLETNSSNFLENDGIFSERVNIIFRQYNNLYFVFVVDDNESELAMIDIIQVQLSSNEQVIVDLINKVYPSACEQDIMANPHQIATIVDEIILAGVVIETNSTELYETLKPYNIVPVKK